MPRFSANLGFLWTELALPDTIHAAKLAGFDAVECHWPYDVPSEKVCRALNDTGLDMLGINTRKGQTGDNGLCALPDRIDEARLAIDEAIDYAAAINCKSVHVMAGISSGPYAEVTFINNLKYACARAEKHDITILIEPLNRFDAPGYFLSTTDHALSLIKSVQSPNIKLMLDLYHVERMEGDLPNKIKSLLPHVGHIQFASVPDRGPPMGGAVDFAPLFKLIDSLGYTRPLGAEYKTKGATEPTLGWLKVLR